MLHAFDSAEQENVCRHQQRFDHTDNHSESNLDGDEDDKEFLPLARAPRRRSPPVPCRRL